MKETSFTIRKRENGKYQAIIRQKVNGVWKQVQSKGGFDKKIQAQQRANIKVSEWQNKIYNDYEQMSVKELKKIYLEYLKNTVRESTYITAASQLNKTDLDHKIITEITPYEYKQFKDSCHYHNIYRFSAFYNYLITELEMEIKNPFKGSKYIQKKKKEVVEVEDFQKILEIINQKISKESTKEKLILVCKIGYYAGLRISEICGLYTTDVNNKSLKVVKQLNATTGKISKTKSTNKNNNKRVVPIPDILWNDLIKYINNQKYIDINKPMLEISSIYASMLLNKALKNTPYEGITTHYFRHSYISFLVQKGLDLNTVAYLAGDNLETIVSKYIHLTKDTYKIAENFIRKIM